MLNTEFKRIDMPNKPKPELSKEIMVGTTHRRSRVYSPPRDIGALLFCRNLSDRFLNITGRKSSSRMALVFISEAWRGYRPWSYRDNAQLIGECSVIRLSILNAFIGLLFSLMLFAAGCAVVPTSTTGELAEKKKVDMVGSTIQEVRTLLGEPGSTIKHANITYLIYGAPGKQGYFILTHPVFYLFALPAPPYGTDDVVHCLLVELHDDRVTRTEFKSMNAYDSIVTDCPRLFSNDEAFMAVATALVTARAREGGTSSALEIASRIRSQKLLRFLAEQGDAEAARWLASEFQEFAPLGKLAEQSDRDAAFEMARRYEELKFIRTLAEQGDAEAAIKLASEFQESAPLGTLAEQGDRDAALEMARRYEEPKFIRTLAEQGDAEAARLLASRFNDPGPLRFLAEQGDAEAANELAKRLDTRSDEEWSLLCRAGKQGHPEAQAKIAGYFERGDGQVPKDLVRAYIWVRAAERNGFVQSRVWYRYKVRGEEAWAYGSPVSASKRIAEQLTPTQIAKAEKLVSDGVPDGC